MNKKEETLATYNATASRMAKKFREIGARDEDIERGFSLLNSNNKNPNVLEIGCGDGRDAKVINKYTNQYLGIDISQAMIEEARKYAPEANFVVADVENYDFPIDLDLVFSFASLLHSNKNKVREVLDKVYSSLKLGGLFYLSLKYDEYHEVSKTDEFGTRTFYFYTPELIKELAGDKYSTVFEQVQNLRGQTWFTIALRKSLNPKNYD